MTNQTSDYPLRIGETLYGFCGGFFGRDSYEDKRIEAIGFDWVVCRDDKGYVHMASDSNNDISSSLREFTRIENRQ